MTSATRRKTERIVVPMPLVPPPPPMPLHNFRCPDDLWERVKEESSEAGISASSFVRSALLMLLMDRDDWRAKERA